MNVQKRVGLRINEDKTKLMTLNARDDPQICIDKEKLEIVDRFIYLGSVVFLLTGEPQRI